MWCWRLFWLYVKFACLTLVARNDNLWSQFCDSLLQNRKLRRRQKGNIGIRRDREMGEWMMAVGGKGWMSDESTKKCVWKEWQGNGSWGEMMIRAYLLRKWNTVLLLDDWILNLLTKSKECTTNLWLQLFERNIQSTVQSVTANDLTVASRKDNTTSTGQERKRKINTKS